MPLNCTLLMGDLYGTLIIFQQSCYLKIKKKNSLIGWRESEVGKCSLQPHCHIPISVTKRKKAGWIFVYNYRALPPIPPHPCCALLSSSCATQGRSPPGHPFSGSGDSVHLLADMTISKQTLLHSAATHPPLTLPTLAYNQCPGHWILCTDDKVEPIWHFGVNTSLIEKLLQAWGLQPDALWITVGHQILHFSSLTPHLLWPSTWSESFSVSFSTLWGLAGPPT